MKSVYTVRQREEPIGTAEVSRQGLYYRIRIRCREPIRASVTGEWGVRDLGQCVPLEGMFGLDTNIPVKQLGAGDFVFHAVERNGEFYLVDSDKPFLFLDKVRSTVLIRRDGETGIQMAISNPTGQ